jgi:hypothetical protein
MCVIIYLILVSPFRLAAGLGDKATATTEWSLFALACLEILIGLLKIRRLRNFYLLAALALVGVHRLL